MAFTELTLLHFLGAGMLMFVGYWLFSRFSRWWGRMRARRYYNRYQAERDAYYNSSNARPMANRNSQNPYRSEEALDYVKDKDSRVQDVAEPKGFWTRLIMGEKMNLIREMIRISRSGEHKGYWQDRVEAQKRVEGKKQVNEDRGR